MGAPANPYAQFVDPGTAPAPAPYPDHSLAQGVREAKEGLHEVAQDFRTAYRRQPESREAPLPANASPMDKALEWFAHLGGTKRNPGGERAAAADRAAQAPFTAPDAAVTGFLHGAAGIDPADVHAAEMGAGYLLGPRTPMAAAERAPSMLSAPARAAAQGARRIVSGAKEAKEQFRLAHGYEPGAPPTPEMRGKAAVTGKAAVRQLAKRLDPTGEKLKFNPVEKRGKPITAAEALGRPAETQLKVAGRRMGQTPGMLESKLRSRREETADRIVNDFGKLTGISPEAAEGDFATEMLKLRQKAGPLYERAYAHTDVKSPELEKLMERPSVKKAMGNAYRIAAEEGRNPEEIGFVRQKVPYQTHLQTSSGQPLTVMIEQDVEVRNPTMQTWDYIKRGLDDVIESYRKNGKLQLDTEGRAAVRTLSDLRGELTNPDRPWGRDYAAALDAGGEPLRQEEAFHAAKGLLSGTMSEREFSERIKGYTAAQRDALKAGIVAQVRNAAMAGRQRLGEMSTPLMRAKLAAVFGQKTAAELMERIEDERFLMAHGARMMPGVGSDTSETLMADQEQRESVAEAARVARHALRGNWSEALMGAIGSPLVGMYRGARQPMDEATRDVIGALLSSKPSELAKVLEEKGATPSEAAHVAGIMVKGGWFKPAARTALLANMAALANGHHPDQPSKAAAPATAKPAADADDSNPYAVYRESGSAEPASKPTPADIDVTEEPAAFTPKAQMADYLEFWLGEPVKITSAYRSSAHNEEVGGVTGSAHTRGEAWDFVPEGMSTEEAGAALANAGILFDQIEITPTHVHISFAPANRGMVIHQGFRREPQEQAQADIPVDLMMAPDIPDDFGA